MTEFLKRRKDNLKPIAFKETTFSVKVFKVHPEVKKADALIGYFLIQNHDKFNPAQLEIIKHAKKVLEGIIND